MFGYASRLSPLLVLILAGIGLLLCVYPPTISGFRVLNAKTPSEERKAETFFAVQRRCANNAGKRHGVGLTNAQSEKIRGQKLAMTGSNDYQPVLINITNEQQADIMAMYGTYFRDEESLKKTQEEMAERRVARNAVVELCPAIPSWNSLNLMKSTDGTSLQLVQSPDNGLNQWILQETCQDPVSNIMNGVSCAERERIVNAVVVDIDTESILLKDVVVSSCAAYTAI